MMGVHFYELLTAIDAALAIAVMFLASGWGLIVLVVFVAAFYFLWKSEQKRIRLQTPYSRLLVVNGVLRCFLLLLTLFTIPWAILGLMAPIAAHYNAYYYKLNLAAIISYFIFAVTAIVASRHYESKQKVAIASLFLLLPFISLLISFYSVTRI
jgi:hypothetical protein